MYILNNPDLKGLIMMQQNTDNMQCTCIFSTCTTKGILLFPGLKMYKFKQVLCALTYKILYVRIYGSALAVEYQLSQCFVN